MIIGHLTREELEANAKSFIEHINRQNMPNLGVLVCFFDRANGVPFTATNVTPFEARRVAEKIKNQAEATVILPENKA